MTNLDQFESVFNAASKEMFRLQDIPLHRVLVVTDLPPDEARAFADDVKKLLGRVLDDDGVVDFLHEGDWEDADGLLTVVKERDPDLLCGYRNMRSKSYAWPYSLGIYLSVLARMVEPPVLVLPHPKVDDAHAWTGINTDKVMVVTDHLAGDAQLISYGVKLTEHKGTLYLAHVEDDAQYAHYMDIIGKIPEIDTDLAKVTIKERLLKEPADYIASCAQVIRAKGIDIDVESIVEMGHSAADYKRFVERFEVDLVVFRTREPQSELLAMHGVAYTLALELSKIPVLMI